MEAASEAPLKAAAAKAATEAAPVEAAAEDLVDEAAPTEAAAAELVDTALVVTEAGEELIAEALVDAVLIEASEGIHHTSIKPFYFSPLWTFPTTDDHISSKCCFS